ncbi:MAG TPA: acyl-ACP--UDP-N-acetylglucosamine O-acyltransferase [Thermoanaerobaculia bacterium]|nr:acyl-ACP--UDP-N-acetylglucosamine O-acyltransferase [Thermoanaerobaculia bacterium]
MSRHHPTAVIHPGAELAEDVVVGPHAVIGEGVVIGPGCEIGAGAQIQGPTELGRENRVFAMAAIGFEPQDLKFRGELVRLEVGDRNQFREFSTLHRGTGKGGGVTRVGSDNLFMTGSHVGHDCQVGSRTIFVNNATLAGHVSVEDDATIGAFSSVHQFCRVGRHAYIGGYTVLTQDALPYVKTTGQKPVCYGLNSIGLRRKGVPEESVQRLSKALRVLLRSGLNLGQALEELRRELAADPYVAHLVSFIEGSERGVVKGLPGRRGARGGGEPGGGEQSGGEDE